jgi:hypothetical protein
MGFQASARRGWGLIHCLVPFLVCSKLMMRRPFNSLIFVICVILAAFPVRAQEPDPIVTWQTLVNQARLDEGLVPYALSSLLSTSAQRHADDLAMNQAASHIGSDGSMPRERIAQAGYAAWTQANGELVAGEDFWIGRSSVEDALAYFLNDPPQRANLLSTTYREMGVGVATDADGRDYYVLDFGVRPNVLPVFINDGATNTDNAQVAIRLPNENVRPEGQGASFMGEAIEIRVSNEPSFENSPWQPWEPLIPWTLPDVPGEHTVYVQFRDAAGRTAAKADTIILGQGVVTAPTPVPPTSTPQPSPTLVPPSATPESVALSMPESTPTSPPADGSVAEPPTDAAPTAIQHTATFASSASAATPFPTWTPLPTATPPFDDVPSDSPAWLAKLKRIALPSLVALQGLVILLGIYLILRRRQGD